MEKPIKMRLAIFIGYSGTPYQGIQYQREEHVKSIEKELLLKLHSSGVFRTDKFTELVKMYKYSRAARTDKGVHALINAFSCICVVPRQYCEQVVVQESTPNQESQKQLITNNNRPQKVKYILKKKAFASLLQELFQDIRIFKVCEVGGHFEMRTSVHCRKYCYICPASLFDNTQNPISFADLVAKLNRLAQYFIGTHNFHNYSRKIKAKDPSAKRYVKNFTCQDFDASECIGAKVNEKWVRFVIEGQSFIYHQIRSMVGMLVQVCINNQPENIIENTFFNNIYKILLAPPQGLYLQHLCFESYNRKQQIPQKLQFVSEELDKIEKLRIELQKEIVTSQIEQASFSDWIDKVRKGVEIKDNDDDNNMLIQQ